MSRHDFFPDEDTTVSVYDYGGDSAAFIFTAPCATAPERDTSPSTHV